jgi:hypothetical protein
MDNQLQYIISAQDNASAVIENVKATAVSAAKATDAQVSASQRFIQVIKEERQENRMRNFAIREGADAVGQLSNIMVGPNGLTKAVQSGMGSFFQFDFALKALGGTFAQFALPVSIAIGAIGLLVSSLRESERAAEASAAKMADLRLEAMKMKVEMNELSKAVLVEAYTTKLAAVIKKQVELRGVTFDLMGTLQNIFSLTHAGSVMAKGVGTPEEIQQTTNEIIKINKEIQGLFKEIEKDIPFTAGVSLVQKLLPQTEMTKSFEMLNKGMAQTFRNAKIGLNEVRSISKDVEEIWRRTTQQIAEGMKTAEYLIQPIHAGIQTMAAAAQRSMGTMWERTFGEAHSLLQMFTQAVLESVARIAAELASMAAIAGLVSAFSGGIFGFSQIFNLLSGGLFGGGSPVSGGGGAASTVVININSPIPHGEWVKNSIQDGLRRTGLTVDKYLVNNRAGVALG